MGRAIARHDIEAFGYRLSAISLVGRIERAKPIGINDAFLGLLCGKFLSHQARLDTLCFPNSDLYFTSVCGLGLEPF